MDVWNILETAAKRHAARTALRSSGAELTYGRLRDRCAALAVSFSELGVDRGDRIGILSTNRLEFMEAYYAAAALGAILVPVNHRLSAREVAGIIDDSEMKAMIVEGGFADLLREAIDEASTSLEFVCTVDAEVHIDGPRMIDYEEAVRSGEGRPLSPAEVSRDDVAHIYYTSGTTGKPKGVMLTHGNVCTHADGAARQLGITEDDVWIHAAPMFHLADAWAVFSITMRGGGHVMLPRFEAGAFLALVERRKVTITNLIPAMLNLVTRHPDVETRELESLRVVLSGGAPIAVEVVRRTMDVLGCDYVQTYGMTETSPFLTFSLLPPHLACLPREERLLYQAKTGRPFEGVDLKVVAEDGAPVAPDGRQVGEILVRGATVTPGYWRRPQETAAAFDDGWLRTGDLAVLDDEGFVNIVDRKKDMIITGGENVYSTEVEAVLYEHEDVLEAAVFGLPDERWGERVAAAVVLRDGRREDPEGIAAFCRTRLAGYKTPKEIRYLDALPRTGSGKIAKRLLKDGPA